MTRDPCHSWPSTLNFQWCCLQAWKPFLHAPQGTFRQVLASSWQFHASSCLASASNNRVLSWSCLWISCLGLGLCLELCLRLHSRLPSDENVMDHMIECAYSYIPDSEVVISMYAVMTSVWVSSANRTFSFAILYYKNPPCLCLASSCLGFFKPWLAMSCLKIERCCLVLVLQVKPWILLCLDKLSLV